MSLRVFKSAEGTLAVEISSPELKSSLKWFVPLYSEGANELQGIEPVDLVKVTYGNKIFYVPFFLVRTVQIEGGSTAVAGSLGYEDSINVLNNIYDRLAYDALSAAKAPKKRPAS